MQNSTKTPSGFEKMSSVVTKASGSTPAFILAILVIVAWLVSGPIFNYSDTWQLVINTGTTIVTFLMVFLIQRSQNKDSISLHLKLNELLIAQELASNRLVSVEDICEDDLLVLQKYYKHLAHMAKQELSVEESHSLNEANIHHDRKKKMNKSVNARTGTNEPLLEKTTHNNSNSHATVRNISKPAATQNTQHRHADKPKVAAAKTGSSTVSKPKPANGNASHPGKAASTASNVVATVHAVPSHKSNHTGNHIIKNDQKTNKPS